MIMYDAAKALIGKEGMDLLSMALLLGSAYIANQQYEKKQKKASDETIDIEYEEIKPVQKLLK